MPNAGAVKALFVLLGLVALVVGLVRFGSTGLRTAQWRSASGMVVGLEAEKGLFKPIVAFNAADGRSVHFTSSEAVPQSRYPVGRSLTVLYDPAHPQHAEIDALQASWRAGILWTVGGLASIAAGFGAARLMGGAREP